MEISSQQYPKYRNLSLFPERKYAWIKTWKLYVIFLGLVTVTMGIVYLILMKSALAATVINGFYILTFFAAGIYQLLIFPKFFQPGSAVAKKKGFIFTIVLTAGIMTYHFIFFFLAGYQNIRLASAGACSFLLPSLIFYCWNCYNKFLTEVDCMPWHMPVNIPDQKVSIFLNSIQIHLRLKINCGDVADKTFLITVPGRSNLGDMFHRFLLHDESRTRCIQIFDGDRETFAWKILVKKGIGFSLLNPGLTLIQNNIRENDTLVFERIIEKNSTD